MTCLWHPLLRAFAALLRLAPSCKTAFAYVHIRRRNQSSASNNWCDSRGHSRGHKTVIVSSSRPPETSSKTNANSVTFTDLRSGATFRLSLGIGAVAAQARHVSVPSSPETWTLGQKRKVIKKVIQKNAKLVLVEEDETRDRVPDR